ncbi:hypothetical protein FRC00_012542, partial [Tulasnella sp. 408]
RFGSASSSKLVVTKEVCPTHRVFQRTLTRHSSRHHRLARVTTYVSLRLFKNEAPARLWTPSLNVFGTSG